MTNNEKEEGESRWEGGEGVEWKEGSRENVEEVEWRSRVEK